MSEDPMVAALLREREGLVQRGQADRVAQVDEQLRLLGAKPPTDEKTDPAGTSSRSTPPKGRRTKRAETA